MSRKFNIILDVFRIPHRKCRIYQGKFRRFLPGREAPVPVGDDPPELDPEAEFDEYRCLRIMRLI